MIRRILSLVLISLFVIQPTSVFTQEPATTRTLQEILADMPQEASRFSKMHPLEAVTTQEGARSGSDSIGICIDPPRSAKCDAWAPKPG